MFVLHDFLIAIILGIVEGFTEFLPISSTGHMILFGYVLGFHGDRARVFEIFIQFGSILSLILFFRDKLCQIFICSFRCKNILCFKLNTNCLCLIHIICGSLPVVMFGLFLYKYIYLIFNVGYVVFFLFLGSIILFFGEICRYKLPTVFNINDISYFQAICVGLFQCFALCPGFSRFGSTLSCGLFVGMSQAVALEFSFFLGIPSSLGAIVLDLYKNISSVSFYDLPMFIIGFFTSFLVSFYFIKKIIVIMKSISFIPFIIYRCCLSLMIYVYL